MSDSEQKKREEVRTSEFRFGDHVEVRGNDGVWHRAVYVGLDNYFMGTAHRVVPEDEGCVVSCAYCRHASW